MCLISEIIRTCSHEEVAQAAVASMGPYFAGKVGSTAVAQGLSIGAFTARAVRDFERLSSEEERRSLREAMDGSDQPILIGLQHILWPFIEKENADRGARRPGSANIDRPGQRKPAQASPLETRKACNSPC
jgi:hypothetical protein